MLATILLLLSTIFPSGSQTAWMEPAAFQLSLGMTRSAVERTLAGNGLKPVAGNDPNHLVIEWAEGRTVTLAFDGGRLSSARFEFVGFVPAVRKAYEEREAWLLKRHGKPSRTIPEMTMVFYEASSPNIHLVLSTDPRSSFGKQGLGFVVVRYFDPPAAVD